MESLVSFTGHQEAREICLRGGKSGFPDVINVPIDIVLAECIQGARKVEIRR